MRFRGFAETRACETMIAIRGCIWRLEGGSRLRQVAGATGAADMAAKDEEGPIPSDVARLARHETVSRLLEGLARGRGIWRDVQLVRPDRQR